ncbi:MAG: glycosyltransferase family 2 protein [Acidobacteriota bacterium]
MRDTLSLVIASHNRGARIGPTLASVFTQTRLPDEVLVFNDGGSPDTRAYIAASFPSVRVVDGVGGNAGAARNLGAQHASSSLVMFLDDDDQLHPDAVDTLLGLHRAFPEAVAAFADHTFTDRVTGAHVANHHRDVASFHRIAQARPVRVGPEGRLFDRRLYYPMLWGGLLQQPWLVRRDVFLALGGFDTAFRSNEDWELYLRLVHAHAIALTDHVISDHIVEPDRAHVSRSANLTDTSREIIRKHVRLALRGLDVRAAGILLRRLGRHYKTDGDMLLHSAPGAAWRAYLRSLRTWPFDHVVVARALVILPIRLATGGQTGAHNRPPV